MHHIIRGSRLCAVVHSHLISLGASVSSPYSDVGRFFTFHHPQPFCDVDLLLFLLVQIERSALLIFQFHHAGGTLRLYY